MMRYEALPGWLLAATILAFFSFFVGLLVRDMVQLHLQRRRSVIPADAPSDAGAALRACLDLIEQNVPDPFDPADSGAFLFATYNETVLYAAMTYFGSLDWGATLDYAVSFSTPRSDRRAMLSLADLAVCAVAHVGIARGELDESYREHIAETAERACSSLVEALPVLAQDLEEREDVALMRAGLAAIDAAVERSEVSKKPELVFPQLAGRLHRPGQSRDSSWDPEDACDSVGPEGTLCGRVRGHKGDHEGVLPGSILTAVHWPEGEVAQ